MQQGPGMDTHGTARVPRRLQYAIHLWLTIVFDKTLY
jgi:hypothetical protein